MHKIKRIIFPTLLGISLTALALGTITISGKSPEMVEGYSASSLPTTIDLNDTTEANIRSYYSSLNNLTEGERKGSNLLKNLKTILKNGQKYYSYENGTSIWQMYEITDRDWTKSPASSTKYGTYNASTNTITGYTYGTKASSSKNNPYIHALYINRDVDNQTTAWDNHNQDRWGINREHVWPKAEGFDSSGAGGARGDPMHLMAGNGYSNNIHSNLYYGYVNTSTSYFDCGDTYDNQTGNLRGTSKTLNTGTVFEPQDSDKGDIARAIFYMVARYNYLSGSDSDGINTNNPNLTLTQNISDWSSSGYTSSTSTQGKLGVLTDLLAWHHADPVDDYEIHRNNLLYTNFTNNRNPFIDFPQWVDFIWGTAVYNGTTYQSYSSEPTGYATPSSDTINGYNSDGSDVQITSLSLDKSAVTINAGETSTITATILPSDATNKKLSYVSDNNDVATVSQGVISANHAGKATITVSTTDGSELSQTVNVTVNYLGGLEIVKSDTISPALATSSGSSTDNLTSRVDQTSNVYFNDVRSFARPNYDETIALTIAGYLYTTTPLGNISALSITYPSNAAKTAKIHVSFGSTPVTTKHSPTSDYTTIKGQSKTDIFINPDPENYHYFQIAGTYQNLYMQRIVIETEISVSFESEQYDIVTDVSELTNGSSVILTGIKEDNYYAMGTYSSGNNIPMITDALTVANGTITAGITNAMKYTLVTGNVSGSFAFKDSNNKYVYAAGSGKNHMKSEDSITDNSSFTITYDDDSEGFNIIATKSSNNNIMSFNSGSSLFSCYANYNQKRIQIFVLNNKTYSKTVDSDLLTIVNANMNVQGLTACDYNGTTPPTNWNTLASNFTSALIEKYHLDVAYSGDANVVQRFLQSYDFVVAKYGATYDFLGRIQSGMVNPNINSKNILPIDQSQIMVISIMSVLILVAIGGTFFYESKKKKRKHI